jgi:hypothetical protein
LLCQMCNFFRLLDDVDEVKVWAPAMRSLSTAEGFALWIPLADVFLAWTSARQGGDPVVAAATIEASLNLVHQSHTYLNEPDLACMLAEVLVLAGKPENALSVTQDALEITRLGSIRHGEPELLRIQGRAAEAMGNMEHAADLYREGIQISHSTGARLFELRCAVALVRLTDKADARAELSLILEGFTEGFDHRDYKHAVALLESRPASEGIARSSV